MCVCALQVDMVQKMTDIELTPHFDVKLWPASNAVRELATQLKTKQFVCIDLKK